MKAVPSAEVVLLVEDDDGARRLITRLLERAGYAVLAVDGGEEALLALERHEKPIHLLLTDLALKGISGVEVARRVGEKRPGMKVLCMSGYTGDEARIRGDLGAEVPFLGKPFTAPVLLESVRHTLDPGGR